MDLDHVTCQIVPLVDKSQKNPITLITSPVTSTPYHICCCCFLKRWPSVLFFFHKASCLTTDLDRGVSCLCVWQTLVCSTAMNCLELCQVLRVCGVSNRMMHTSSADLTRHVLCFWIYIKVSFRRTHSCKTVVFKQSESVAEMEC